MTFASGQNQTFARFQNLTKRVFAKSVDILVPEDGTICQDVPFQAGEKSPGDEYVVPVSVTREAGHTFNADGSAFQLRRARASATELAKIRGNETVSRTTMSYAVIKRAMKGTGSKEGDKRAFVNATKYQMQNLVKAAKFVREASLIYGGGTAQAANLGVVLNTTGSAGTSLVVQLTVASWATGLWVGSEGTEYDFYSSAFAARSTAGTDAAGDNVFLLSTVDPLNRRLTFTSNATNVGNVVATDIMIFAGAYQKEQLGIAGVVATSGAVWNISNSSYYLWKPKNVDVGSAQLTFEALQTGAAKAAEVGYEGQLNVYVNPFTWQDIADDEAALVNYAHKSGGAVEKGFNSITFNTQVGKMKLKPHKLMKQGEAYGLPADACYRIGSTDVTFEMNGQEMTRHLEDYAGVEVRAYQDQAFFSENPGAIVRWQNIVNTKNSAS